MKKNVPLIILAIVGIVLLIAYIDSTKQVKQLQQELAQLKSGIAPAPPVQDAEAGTTDLATSLETAGDSNQIANVEISEPVAESPQSSGRRMMENMAKMMDNPTMNQVMEASQRGAVGALYTDLIAYLNLNGEETKYFMDLLMHRQMAQVNSAMKMMSGSLSDEEKEALQQEVKDATELVKTEMENFLNNPDDYAEFEFYEKTMGERMMLSQMDKDLAGSNTALPDDTYRELLGMMHDERENFDFSSDLNDQQNTDMSAARFSKDNVQNYASDIQQLNDAICTKAKSILTDEQYEAFVGSLQTYTDMQLSQLEMAQQMFGGGE